jgi:hypothetical protein
MNISSSKTPKGRKIFYLPETSSSVDNTSSRFSIDSDQSFDSTRWYQLSPINYGSQNYTSNDHELIDMIKSMQIEISCLKNRIHDLEVKVNHKKNKF